MATAGAQKSTTASTGGAVVEETADSPSASALGLSKNILGLRFMQRQVEADRREQLARDERERAAQAKWHTASGAARQNQTVVKMKGYAAFDDVEITQHYSFQSANESLEKYIDQERYALAQADQRARKASQRASTTAASATATNPIQAD
ncbi:uncharacterized protein MONBRDRAFT_11428, partial [Monosiga brevicollis MX1]